jgi:hypothetical protein
VRDLLVFFVHQGAVVAEHDGVVDFSVLIPFGLSLTLMSTLLSTPWLTTQLTT